MTTPPAPSRNNPFVQQPPLPPLDDEDDNATAAPASFMSASYTAICMAGGGDGGEGGEGGGSNEDDDDHESHRRRPHSLTCGRAADRDAAPMPPATSTTAVASSSTMMTTYVADDLIEQIKLASPTTAAAAAAAAKQATSDIDIDGGLTAMSGGVGVGASAVPRRFLQQSQAAAAHQIDVTVISDIECEAQYLAAAVDTLTESLGGLLHSISSMTADNVEVYRSSVTRLTDSMDANIKSMYTIMAKTEEIGNLMRPAEQLAVRIHDIKRLVDMLDMV